MSVTRAFTDQADAQKRRALGAFDKMNERQYVDDVRHVMDSPQGRRVVAAFIYEICEANEISWERASGIKDGGSAFAHLAFHQGVQITARRLEKLLEDCCPELFDLMGKEYREFQRGSRRFVGAHQPRGESQ